MRALALVVLGGLTAAMIIGQWFVPSFSALLPLVVAYFLFNFGFALSVAKAGSMTKATRLGTVAVLLNFLAMFVSAFENAWIVISSAATIMAFAAAFLLLKEATSATA